MTSQKAHRRCNQAEINRVQSAVNNAYDVLRLFNEISEDVQITNVRITPDAIPNARGCTLEFSAFVYAEKEIEQLERGSTD